MGRTIAKRLIGLAILSFPAAPAAYMIGLPFRPAPRERSISKEHIVRGGAGSKRDDVLGDTMLRLTPPTSATLLISVILAAVAVGGQLFHQISNFLPISMFWLAVIAYIVLLLGNLIRGF